MEAAADAWSDDKYLVFKESGGVAPPEKVAMGSWSRGVGQEPIASGSAAIAG